MDIKIYLNEKRDLIETALARFVPSQEGPFATHFESMRYSLFVGGKRIRPILCLAAAASVDGSSQTEKALLPVAAALECIHTYSLIHDDLPAMDDDTLRRGKPTNHTIYGEAEAILAGDSLLTWAFDLLSNSEYCQLAADKHLAIISVIARGAGPLGMAGGQSMDIANENKQYPFTTLQTIHKNKTGALITSSILAGAIGAGASAKQYADLTEYGDQIGLAFQIVDDLLDATSTTEKLGKSAGSDATKGKATYPAFFGIEKTRKRASEAVEAALSALSEFDDRAAPLRSIAQYIVQRSH